LGSLSHRRPVRRCNYCFRIRAPLALVAAGIYVLGAITGGSLFALLRQSVEKSKQVRA
jgi:hypothetical protein